jgi:hypothetical protein
VAVLARYAHENGVECGAIPEHVRRLEGGIEYL